MEARDLREILARMFSGFTWSWAFLRLGHEQVRWLPRGRRCCPVWSFFALAASNHHTVRHHQSCSPPKGAAPSKANRSARLLRSNPPATTRTNRRADPCWRLPVEEPVECWRLPVEEPNRGSTLPRNRKVKECWNGSMKIKACGRTVLYNDRCSTCRSFVPKGL